MHGTSIINCQILWLILFSRWQAIFTESDVSVSKYLSVFNYMFEKCLGIQKSLTGIICIDKS